MAARLVGQRYGFYVLLFRTSEANVSYYDSGRMEAAVAASFLISLTPKGVRKTMESFVTFSPGLPNSAPPMVLPVFGPPRVGPLGVWSPWSPGENVAKLGTTLPLSYQSLFILSGSVCS